MQMRIIVNCKKAQVTQVLRFYRRQRSAEGVP